MSEALERDCLNPPQRTIFATCGAVCILMGKVTTYCQISGCSPEAAEIVDYAAEEDEYGSQVQAALRLLTSPDEATGQQDLSIIGPFDDDGETWLDEIGDSDQALALPEERIHTVSGCTMGDMFDMGFCHGPNGGSDGVLISFGPCFFVLTVMLPILDAATDGRMSPYRLWKLAMTQGHLDARNEFCLEGVEYGPVEDYWEQFPWMFGRLSQDDVQALEDRDSPEEIAEVLQREGYWMWMRPDRFPIEPSDISQSSRGLLAFTPAQSIIGSLIARLPIELLSSIALLLPLADVVSLASTSKSIYGSLLGDATARDVFARTYIRDQAPWYLPYGEIELKWWNDRNGDQAIGWDYMRRCWSESHSMRNRKRIWRACESIEQRCDEKGVA